MSTTKEVAKQPAQQAPSVSPSERFTASVLKEMTNINGGQLQVTDFQRKLMKNYFIAIDAELKKAETKRLAKKQENRDPLEYSWANVNLAKLSTDVVAFSSVGLDPLQKNNVFPIPYKNSKTNQFDISFTRGYNGLELVARKYGYEVPDDVVIEVVFSKDTFKIHKKNKDNKEESYTFDINDPFDRGDIVGGFYFYDFFNEPKKNKVVHFTLQEILKRRPDSASPEFWGGEKPIWKDGKKTKETEKVDGWFKEMCWKTIKRAAWDQIVIDSQKIDDQLLQVLQTESSAPETPTAQEEVNQQIQESANKKEIDFVDTEHVDVTNEGKETEQSSPEEKEAPSEPEKQPEVKKESVMDQKVPSASIVTDQAGDGITPNKLF